MNSRRKFLTGTAATGAAALAFSAFPPSIRRALAIPANNKTGTIMDVEHVVILMQENRSFDHYFGMLMGVRGFGDRFAIPLAGGRRVWEQSDANGKVVLPYHLDQTKGNAQRVTGTPHGWTDAQNAWDGGRLSQWPKHKATDTAPFTQSMGYLQEAELQFQYALANAFTMCDAYHCSMHTGTNSNRLFHWSGTNGPSGQTGSGLAGVSSVNNAWDNLRFPWDPVTNPGVDSTTYGCNWTTYPERLQDAKVSWMVYQNLPENFTDNPLAGFQKYRVANRASGKNDMRYDDNAGPPAGVTLPAYDPASDDAGNPLYKGVANTMPGDGGLLGTFKRDVANGKLAQVSWIVAPAEYSEHPGPSSPVQGAWYIQQVLDALTASPDVWSKTVFIVNFDENDGYFDHVPSPAAPSINPDKSVAGKTTLSDADVAFERYTHPLIPGTPASVPAPDGRVYGPGPRVPMYVISPWSRGGWVNSQVFDHTSVLRFLEVRFGVKETNISPFRRAITGDLTSAFNFATPNSEVLPTLAGRKTRAEADQLRTEQEKLSQIPLPATQALPQQATGTRPSRALPYELHTSAKADVANGKLQLLFLNTGKAAAVFHVYDKRHLDRLPRRYMLEAGKGLDDTWAAVADDSGVYDLWVLGPNGFHRHFKGHLDALRTSGATPEVRVCYDIANGNIYLNMRNDGKAACKFTINAKAYRNDGPWTATVNGGANVDQHWELAASGQWYDFAVTCDADPGYFRRFAGRVETGKHTVSDPAMGRADL
ncbi:phosphocholine-specific phospholipase C [Verminephrobacter aporrectodeae]|uniref:phosphocholine-specific phospholipase C n=1 Tax=Verminephrobacter aporrectodeae TaxID=1110389 RepID=UPI0022382980|nr:phospholipase C, phosphocholine-specific [Verminephrobacter aporrectodeae]MCW5255671.1 phospholipase C, phosphocholine-specific [Verminephrobacter aporrectodeae subsp. tuberculatae]MCW8176738.1 phospholipase C, phosphocholine-specific [Verminephrobacter aporrectodeae subsp. tuberculatae]MCW8204513.1 phospholipase C, phosphocholine-specific [Verminephrobacter aporrectodeae subsp. tuberculatae]MCW8207873.1 phospholipase C, phosphocholine-specific [Verminephrobacter aporrectodeae subsp. tubercu